MIDNFDIPRLPVGRRLCEDLTEDRVLQVHHVGPTSKSSRDWYAVWVLTHDDKLVYKGFVPGPRAAARAVRWSRKYYGAKS